MKAFEAIFFDMDGTFVNSEPHWLAAETELMAEFGHQWVLEDQQFCLGGPLTKVGKYMYEIAGRVQTPEWFRDELVKRTLVHMRTSVEFMPGALELLFELKALGIPVGLVTASPAEMMEATLSAMEENYFDVAISGDDVAITKPDPEGYILAAERLGVNIENSIILEDSLTGISAGIASGAFVVAIPHIIEAKSGVRMKVIKSLSDIHVSDLEEMFSRAEGKVVI
jgi:HAD superfamily hydrolase (TIGR01509 family)